MPPPRQQSFTQEHLFDGDTSIDNHTPAGDYLHESSLMSSNHIQPRSQQQFYPTDDSWVHNSATRQQTQHRSSKRNCSE
jgi:hypothetical protein